MSAEKNPEKDPKKDPEKETEKMNFEFIEESEIESVKRGRKAVVIPEMVQFLAKAKVGQNVKLNGLALGETFATAEEKKTAKASVSATIRNQAKIAGWNKVRIVWTIENIPVAKRVA